MGARLLIIVCGTSIETVPGCDQINAFIEVRDASGYVIASGSCQIDRDGTPTTDVDDDSLGFDEAGKADNMPGCTAFVGPILWQTMIYRMWLTPFC